MHVANCEYLLLSISCEINADQCLFVMDLNERWSDSTNLVWSIVGVLGAIANKIEASQETCFFCLFFCKNNPSLPQDYQTVCS